MANKSVKIAGWPKGMDNIHTAEELVFSRRGIEDLSTLRDAVNVDILDAGNVRRRKGYALLAAGKAHSLFSDGTIALAVLNDNLVRIETNKTITILKANVGFRTMQYVSLNNEIYFCNGQVSGKVVDSGIREWGVETPTRTPNVGIIAGNLDAGKYQITCTFENIYGEESGTSPTQTTIVSSGGLSITAPTANSNEVAKCLVYITLPDSELFYLIGSIAPGSTFNLSSAPNYGKALSTMLMSKLLAGELVEYYRGRMYVAVGNILWYSEPYRFGLYNPRINYIVFSKTINLIKAVTNGFYVASDRTYWFGGTDANDFEQREVLPFGAARYSASNLLDSIGILWLSDRGLITAENDGKVRIVQDNYVRPNITELGATFVREQDSLTQYVSVGRSTPYASPLSATDYWDAEIERKAQ